jgi:hypothetical protein
MFKVKKTTVKKTRRTDRIIFLRQQYEGDIHADPKTYNRAAADVLRKLADAIEKVGDGWVDPEIVMWLDVPGEITAEATLSPAS